MLIVPARVIVIAMRTEDHGCLPYFVGPLFENGTNSEIKRCAEVVTVKPLS